MAPAILRRAPSGEHIRQLSRSVSSSFTSISKKAVDVSEPPIVSIFALILSRAGTLSERATSVLSDTLHSSTSAGVAAAPLPIVKRQNAILAIPTTYKGLNAGPAPGAVAGIILGSIAGFILCLYILLLSFQFVGGRTSVVEEEVVVTRRAKSRSRSRHTVMTERTPPPAQSPPRQSSRRETIIIEERVRVPPPPREPEEPDEVIVEEEQSVSEDVVEVIEEHSTVSPSPPPKPAKRESRRSGYRTVDPAEFGGGSAPLRRVKKR